MSRGSHDWREWPSVHGLRCALCGTTLDTGVWGQLPDYLVPADVRATLGAIYGGWCYGAEKREESQEAFVDWVGAA